VRIVPGTISVFPGAFSAVFTSEMAAFDERLETFEDAGAETYGISTDLPFAPEAFGN
jgi:alkyl hydroperoxide reductase subunit AhpC